MNAARDPKNGGAAAPDLGDLRRGPGLGEWTLIARSLEDTHALARRLAEGIRAHLADPRLGSSGALTSESRSPGSGSVLIGLGGDLGAGKTAFVQGFVAALAPDRDLYVTSPTFAIVQTYDTEPPVTHMDLYRLGSLDELEAIGYRDLYFASGVTLVEWISRVPEAVPNEWIEIDLAVLPADVREIRVRPHADRLLAMVEQVLG